MSADPSRLKLKETDLFPPLKNWLEGQGYSVHAEVRNCDIVARKEGELILIEMKKNLSLSLLTQAVARKEITDSVYIAVPVPQGKLSPPHFRRVKALLRRLEVGCILIDFLKTKVKLRVELHPVPFAPRSRPGKKRALLREIDGRYAEFNLGGETSTTAKMTAYRQEALKIAWLLSRTGPAAPRDLRRQGSSEKTQSILSRNVYGWFERISRGLYRLHPAGTQALEKYAEVIHHFTE